MRNRYESVLHNEPHSSTSADAAPGTLRRGPVVLHVAQRGDQEPHPRCMTAAARLDVHVGVLRRVARVPALV